MFKDQFSLIAKFKNNYIFLFILVTILVINNFLFCKWISKLVIIISINLLLMKYFHI